MVQAEAAFPGFLKQFLPHPIDGLESFEKMFDALENAKDAIKVYCVVGKLGR
jgi:glucose 1-dehydrogenase